MGWGCIGNFNSIIMGTFQRLRDLINSAITQNGNNRITGQILNSVLNQMVDTIDDEKVGNITFKDHKYANVERFATPDYFYAFPNTAVSNEDDVILTKRSSIYIPDFTIVDILNAYDEKQNIQVRTHELFDAVEEEKIIFIKEYADSPGKNVCSYFREDLLYLRILTNDALINLVFPHAYDQELEWENIDIRPLYNGGLTPSGDPMHYMYETAGARWNADTKRWALDEIEDLTTDEVRLMYSKWNKALFPFAYNDKDNIRTIFPFVGYSSNGASNVLCNPNLEIIPPATGNNVIAGTLSSWFYGCSKLRKIKVVLDNINHFGVAFKGCSALEYVRIERLNKDVSFVDSPLLSNESILYMIEKSNATTLTTITLHPDALARAEADATIQASLAQHPYIKLSL